jgi:hypothetical protein
MLTIIFRYHVHTWGTQYISVVWILNVFLNTFNFKSKHSYFHYALLPCRKRSPTHDRAEKQGFSSSPGLVKWDLWWTKWRWGRFSPSTSVSPATLHSTNCSTITLINHLGLYNRPEVAAVPGDVSPTPWKKKTPGIFTSRKSPSHLGLVWVCVCARVRARALFPPFLVFIL